MNAPTALPRLPAADAWAATIGTMAGVDLLIAPRRRPIAVVDPTPPVPESVPLTIDLETGSYFQPKRDGVILVGGHFDGTDDPDQDPTAYDVVIDDELAARAVENAAEYTGSFGLDTRSNAAGPGCARLHPIITGLLRRWFPAS